MLLLQLKKILQDRKVAHLDELAGALNAEPAFVRQMLAVWCSKGKVRLLSMPAGCGVRCVQCKPETVERYEWIDEQSGKLANRVSSC